MTDYMTSINGLMLFLLCRSVDQTLAMTLTQFATDWVIGLKEEWLTQSNSLRAIPQRLSSKQDPPAKPGDRICLVHQWLLVWWGKMLSKRAMAVMRHFQELKTILSVTREEWGLVLLTKLCNAAAASSLQIIKLFPSGSFGLHILLSGPHVLILINNYKCTNKAHSNPFFLF